MPFIKYQHIERLGSVEVDGLIDLEEPCYVFPKIDGTNASVWNDDGVLGFGSRNRQLSIDSDNHGFMAEMSKHYLLMEMLKAYPHYHLFGEWLVPHTLKEYEENAWRQFYVFDVCVYTDYLQYVPYEEYKPVLDQYGIEYIPPLAIVERGTEERFAQIMNNNTYLMKDGEIGEGIVIKRYGFKNRFGRTVWAKMVRSEFKTRHTKAMGPQEFKATAMVEESIVSQFVTRAMIEKVFANIVNEHGTWESKFIPRLLHTVYYDLIREESWNFVKANKNPKIDFGILQKFTYSMVKQVKPELF